jgi:hypothetical protein
MDWNRFAGNQNFGVQRIGGHDSFLNIRASILRVHPDAEQIKQVSVGSDGYRVVEYVRSKKYQYF